MREWLHGQAASQLAWQARYMYGDGLCIYLQEYNASVIVTSPSVPYKGMREWREEVGERGRGRGGEGEGGGERC